MGTKRTRYFILEHRTIPSTLGRWLGRGPTEWKRVIEHTTLDEARRDWLVLAEIEGPDPTFLGRGTEYRVRRTDRPAG